MKLALAGDTMLGRNVGERLAVDPPAALFSEELVRVVQEADLFVLNLECAISDRGERWPDPFKRFFFRAPPVAVEALRLLGVDAVTLANNHALDYGVVALLDTLELLASEGIGVVGAGVDVEAARSPLHLDAAGETVAVVAFTDHAADFAAGPAQPGVAFADLAKGVPDWVVSAVRELAADIVLVTPHWGPNMVVAPVAPVRAAAPLLRAAGAGLIAGHSAHVFHGAAPGILYDLGDFIDDYATDPVLRNDLGLLWLVDIDGGGVTRAEAVPLKLDYCSTRLAAGGDADADDENDDDDESEVRQ
jgi:poly-gamma-glutamate capsule biosynthesis protein CapA/YwtB (metallophosphatase superfamily)